MLRLIGSLDVGKASGPDGISITMLKNTALSIASPLARLFNLSICSAVFPDIWKKASVVPIPKGSKSFTDSPAGYRPISLLSVVSKMLEHHYHAFIMSHLSAVSPLALNQWGFQSRKSTISALLSVVHRLHLSLEDGQEVAAIFYDLKKAFDSVPHLPLLAKLSSFGIHPSIFSWVTSYLTSRSQQVVLNGVTSTACSVVSGEPQGSVLGPLLFILYTDEITRLSFAGSLLNSYADDMVLFSSIRHSHDFDVFVQDHAKLCSSIQDHFLTLNSSKCKGMVFFQEEETFSFSFHMYSRGMC